MSYQELRVDQPVAWRAGDVAADAGDTLSAAPKAPAPAHESPVRAVWNIPYSPDGSRLATASSDGSPRIWEAATGRALAILGGHAGNVVELGVSSDGRLVATACFDGTARVWDIASGRAVRTLAGDAAVLDVDFSPDGTRLATASLDGTAKLWDARSGRELLSLTIPGAGAGHLAFSPDGTRLAVGDVTGTVRLYPLRTDELVKLARSGVPAH